MSSTFLSGICHKINYSFWCQLVSQLVTSSFGKLLILVKPEWTVDQAYLTIHLRVEIAGTSLRSLLSFPLFQFTKIKSTWSSSRYMCHLRSGLELSNSIVYEVNYIIFFHFGWNKFPPRRVYLLCQIYYLGKQQQQQQLLQKNLCKHFALTILKNECLYSTVQGV